jgi:hypothetical protein
VKIPLGGHGWQDKPLFTTQAQSQEQVLFVHMRSPIAPGTFEQLNQLEGVRTLNYFPHDTYLVHVEDEQASKRLTEFPGVAWVRVLND